MTKQKSPRRKCFVTVTRPAAGPGRAGWDGAGRRAGGGACPRVTGPLPAAGVALGAGPARGAGSAGRAGRGDRRGGAGRSEGRGGAPPAGQRAGRRSAPPPPTAADGLPANGRARC